MQIVTVASHAPTEPYYFYDSFLKSCRRFGHEPIVLNQGFGGIGTKPRLLKFALEGNKITHQHMIFCDAFDVVFQSDPQSQEPYLSDAIVFNAEKNCFPNPKLADKFPETNTPYRYLNSGFSIGPTELYLQALREMKAGEILDDHYVNEKRIEANDQLDWQNQYLFGNVPIRLDVQAQYCQALAGVTDDELLFDDGAIRNKITGTTPLAFHANGGKEVWKDRILNHLKLGKESVA